MSIYKDWIRQGVRDSTADLPLVKMEQESYHLLVFIYVLSSSEILLERHEGRFATELCQFGIELYSVCMFHGCLAEANIKLM